MGNAAMGSDGAVHYANDFSDRYSDDYFCPNEDCGVRLYLKGLGMEEKEHGSIRPYFSAFPNAGHIKGCPFEGNIVTRAELDASGFTVDGFFSRITKANGKSVSASASSPGSPPESSPAAHSENKITTVAKLYIHCLQHGDMTTIPTADGDVPIYKIYQADRNVGITGTRNRQRLIKLNFINCKFELDDKYPVAGETGFYKIWTIFKHTDSSVPPGQYYWLCFREKDIGIMNDICKKLTPLKSRLKGAPLPIVVAGEWVGHSCVITSKRQIHIPNIRD